MVGKDVVAALEYEITNRYGQIQRDLAINPIDEANRLRILGVESK